MRFFVLPLMVGMIAAAPVRAATLEEALVQTYLTNPGLESARARLRSADEEVPIALGGWRPSLRIDGSAAAVSLDTDVVDDNRGQTQIGIALSQSIFAGGETVARVNQAEAAVLSERARLNAVEQQVLGDTIEVYTALLRDTVVLQLAVGNLERLRSHLDGARRRLRVGEVTRTDVQQAESRLARAVADQAQAQGNVESSAVQYRRLVGEPPQTLSPAPLPAGLPQSRSEAEAQAENNPTVLFARYDLEATEANVNVAQSTLLPTLDLIGRVDRFDNRSLTFDYEREASVSLNLRVPLYQGGAEYAQLRQAKQDVLRRLADLDEARRSAREDAGVAWEALQTARAGIAANRAQVEAARAALEGVRQEVLVGARTTLDLLDAEQELFSAEVSLTRAERERLSAAYQLKSAVGELTVTELGLPVEAFDDTQYYENVRDKLIGFGDPLPERLESLEPTLDPAEPALEPASE